MKKISPCIKQGEMATKTVLRYFLFTVSVSNTLVTYCTKVSSAWGDIHF